jgi:hypothetical protein
VLANGANAVNPAMAAICNVFLIVPVPGRAIFVRSFDSTCHYSPAHRNDGGDGIGATSASVHDSAERSEPPNSPP